jgi:hypothetical protein
MADDNCTSGLTVLKWIMFVLISAFGMGGCGGGGGMAPLVLGVTPSSANTFVDFEAGTFSSATLTATLSDGTIPTDVQWTTSQGCVAISSNTNTNSVSVVGNRTCGGVVTSTITAAAQGLTGKASVTCTFR